MPLALGALLLGCAQAQLPKFTFAASNYHPPADQATIVQSPGLDEGEPIHGAPSRILSSRGINQPELKRRLLAVMYSIQRLCWARGREATHL